MATRKHTFIFRLGDSGITEDDLYRLATVSRYLVSYRGELEDHKYTSVQLFTDTKMAQELLFRAEIRPLERCVLVAHIARRNGDAAVAQAESRLRKPPAKSIVRDCALRIPDDTARLNWLEARGAGLNLPNCSGGLAHVWLADGFDRPVHHYDQTYRDVIDRAMGYKPMGSTPATRRSKRSA